MKNVIETDGAPAPAGPYVQGIRAGEMVVLSGQVGVDPQTGKAADGIAAQARQALANLDAVLSVAGGSLADLVKTTCFLASLDDFAAFNEVYDEVLGGHRPTRSTVGVQLPAGYLVEIEGIALLG